MFKILQEANNPELLRLTSTQKAVLLTIFVAGTPELAAEATVGNEYVISASNFLGKNGLVTSRGGGLQVTSGGLEALLSNGLVDEQDQITDIGKELMDAFAREKQELEESLIPYKTFKGIFKLSN